MGLANKLSTHDNSPILRLDEPLDGCCLFSDQLRISGWFAIDRGHQSVSAFSKGFSDFSSHLKVLWQSHDSFDSSFSRDVLVQGRELSNVENQVEPFIQTLEVIREEEVASGARELDTKVVFRFDGIVDVSSLVPELGATGNVFALCGAETVCFSL